MMPKETFEGIKERKSKSIILDSFLVPRDYLLTKRGSLSSTVRTKCGKIEMYTGEEGGNEGE